MAKYAISHEGADAMRKLSQDILATMNSVQTSTKELKNKISGLMDGIGIYGIDIWAMTMRIDGIIEDKQDALTDLADSARKQSEEIDNLVNELSGVNGSSGGNAATVSGLFSRPDPNSSSKNYASLKEQLDKADVGYRLFNASRQERTTEEIVARLGGGDRTRGSCSSLAFAFIGNTAGYDILDFRDGDSRSFFSKDENIERIASLPGVKSETRRGLDSLPCARELLDLTEPGKVYYFATGSHAAIIRNRNGLYEYLELQHATDNGWNVLTDERLVNRFHCKANRLFENESFLIDSDSLANCQEFLDLLGYLNTAEDDQMKGASGNVR